MLKDKIKTPEELEDYYEGELDDINRVNDIQTGKFLNK